MKNGVTLENAEGNRGRIYEFIKRCANFSRPFWGPGSLESLGNREYEFPRLQPHAFEKEQRTRAAFDNNDTCPWALSSSCCQSLACAGKCWLSPFRALTRPATSQSCAETSDQRKKTQRGKLLVSHFRRKQVSVLSDGKQTSMLKPKNSANHA